MRISDWSSDVCSSDLLQELFPCFRCPTFETEGKNPRITERANFTHFQGCDPGHFFPGDRLLRVSDTVGQAFEYLRQRHLEKLLLLRSEEHTSELQSLMRISYAVFCLKKKKIKTEHTNQH